MLKHVKTKSSLEGVRDGHPQFLLVINIANIAVTDSSEKWTKTLKYDAYFSWRVSNPKVAGFFRQFGDESALQDPRIQTPWNQWNHCDNIEAKQRGSGWLRFMFGVMCFVFSLWSIQNAFGLDINRYKSVNQRNDHIDSKLQLHVWGMLR